MSDCPPCPRCGSPTKLRSSRRGPFYSCSLFPQCKGSIDVRDPAEPHKPPPPARLGVPYGALPVYGVTPGHSSDPYQQAVIDHRSGWVVVSAAAGCHAKGQGILLDSGEVCKVEDIKVGDLLRGYRTGPRRVLSLCRGRGRMYAVEPADGSGRFVVNEDHVLTVGMYVREIFYISAARIDVSVRDFLRWPEHLQSYATTIRVHPSQKDAEDHLFFKIRALRQEDDYYGFTLDGDGRYLLDDFTVTHNSGKSYSLVERTASLLSEGEIPESICLLSYNSDAAQLLRDRLKHRVNPYAAKRLEIRTFHAWCYLVLRYWYPEDQRLWPGHILGGSDGPSPYKVAAPLASRHDIPVGLALRAAEKISEGLHPLTEEGVCEAMRWSAGNDKAGPVAEFLREFAAEKRERKLIDFGDMLAEVALAILYHPENAAVQALSSLYRHVMVDECQDASLPRSIVARWLGQRSQSLLCVGDPSQAIASHAGGRLDLFIDLATSPGVSVLSLPVNRRSSRRIVEASNEVIRGQPWNLSGDTLPRDGAPDGEPVQVWETKTPNEESERVIQDIQRRVAAGTPMEVDGKPTFVCLLRTNALIVNLEHAFVARGIPVRIAGSPGGVWSSTAGTEFLAYLEGVEGIPTFNLLSVVNKPRRFAKKAEVGAVIEQAQSAEKMGVDFSLHDLLKEHTSKGLQRLGKDLSNTADLPWARRCKKVLAWLLDVEDEEEDPDEDRRGALEALCEAAVKAGSIAGIYQHKREASRGQREPAVELSTIHSGKGKEWPVVYGCAVRSEVLPHKKCSGPDEVDEERRLLYVLVTRARDALIISTGGKPSKFLRELGWVEERGSYQ